MREIFSRKIVEFAKINKNFVVLTGDHGYAIFDLISQEAPNQFFNAGVAEQNMVGISAGLAKIGFKPLIYALSSFVPIRALEQIKMDIAHDNLPVIIIGDGAGLVYSHLGTSHQCLEDIAVLMPIPNIEILSPADRFEMSTCLDYAYQNDQPTYIRMGKSDLKDVHKYELDIENIKKPMLISPKRTSNKLAFLATGSMVSRALLLSETFFQEADVYSIPFIKPINTQFLSDILKLYRKLVIFEEHSVFGGLGSIILKNISELSLSTQTLLIGSENKFSEHCGTYDYLLKEHGLDFDSIKFKISLFLEK